MFSFHAIKNITPALKAVSSSRITRNSPINCAIPSFTGLAFDAQDRQGGGRARHKRRISAEGYKYIICPTSNAAIALAQLRKLDALNARRAAIAAQYHRAMADLPFQPLSLPSRGNIFTHGIYSLSGSMKPVAVLPGISDGIAETKASAGAAFPRRAYAKILSRTFPNARLTPGWNLASGSAHCRSSRTLTEVRGF
ncbi:DegT/DnrJ/EryC1/StrS family aminotransferase [Salmonella enterica subsp. enterica serovar Weltevreden]|nr:DegT/DnrJ/EryC1/StrS family aminotransferase [Salmonella enterica subsp. enterica serovar Weltevreden]